MVTSIASFVIKFTSKHTQMDFDNKLPIHDAWTGVIDRNSSRLCSFWMPVSAGIIMKGNDMHKPTWKSRIFFTVVATTYAIKRRGEKRKKRKSKPKIQKTGISSKSFSSKIIQLIREQTANCLQRNKRVELCGGILTRLVSELACWSLIRMSKVIV